MTVSSVFPFFVFSTAVGPGPTSEEGADEDAEAWDGKPEIEYHVSDDEDDEDSDE